MRTIHDLETAFADLADTAPDADVLSAPTAPVRRPLRRTLAPAAAALVTAAVIGGVLVATVPDDDEPAPAAEPVAALPYPAAEGPVDTTFRFTAQLPGGQRVVRSYGIDRGGQRLEFRRRDTQARCTSVAPIAQQSGNCGRVGMVTLLDKGRPTSSDAVAFDPDRLVGRVRQDVGGRLGYFGTLGSGIGAPGLTDGLRSVHLYWQYAPGAWGDALAPTKSQALALARSVRPATERLDVPALLEPRAHQYLNTVEWENSSVGGSYELSSKDAKYGIASVSWGTGRYVVVGDVVDLEGTKINGRTWQFGHVNGQTEARLKDSAIPVTVSGTVGMSVATLRGYLEHVRFAGNLKDRSTWFAASKLR